MTMLSVVIPAFNEADGIYAIVQRVLAIQPALAAVGIEELEMIVVDDGSTDGTAGLVPAQPHVRLIQHAQNGGYGAALKTGFAAAKGEWLGFMDADGTYPPEYYPHLYKAACAHNADIVLGSRMAGAHSQMPVVRRLGNLIFAKLVSLISARQVTDSASGMRIFRKAILPRLYPLPDGLNFTTVMSTRALHEELTMVETPIPYSERLGRSKLSVVKDGVRFAQSIVWTALNYNPVRPLGLIGIVALAIAGFIGLGLIIARLSGINDVDPLGAFALFSALVLVIGGISTLTLGMSFNYFVALFHKTPVQQGLFGRSLVRRRIDHYLGWSGLLFFLCGLSLAGVSLVLGLGGWEVSRLWLYYLTSASLALVGIQLTIAWIQIQVLDTLRIRDALVADDLQGKARLSLKPRIEENTGLPVVQPSV
ncbi:MAG: glycosyltransferase family 2 protein [Caldilineaceae bacterium]|nr:glycosyltransferase family 2 protein [Caldilineaceae bacterium]